MLHPTGRAHIGEPVLGRTTFISLSGGSHSIFPRPRRVYHALLYSLSSTNKGFVRNKRQRPACTQPRVQQYIRIRVTILTQRWDYQLVAVREPQPGAQNLRRIFFCFGPEPRFPFLPRVILTAADQQASGSPRTLTTQPTHAPYSGRSLSLSASLPLLLCFVFFCRNRPPKAESSQNLCCVSCSSELFHHHDQIKTRRWLRLKRYASSRRARGVRCMAQGRTRNKLGGSCAFWVRGV